MKRRVLVLPAAAAVIAGLVLYKELQPRRSTNLVDGPPAVTQPMQQPAPAFEGLDAENKLVKLQAYLGRHRILVAFFDRRTGLAEDERLRRLKEDFAALEGAGYVVLAVSDALPQENRAAMERAGDVPFPVVSDPGFAAQKTWGRYDEASQSTVPGLFVIDRAGRVDWRDGKPLPVEDVKATLEQIIRGN